MNTALAFDRKDLSSTTVKNSDKTKSGIWKKGFVLIPRMLLDMIWQLPKSHRDVAHYFLEHGGIWGEEFPELVITVDRVASGVNLKRRRTQEILADLCKVKFFKKRYRNGSYNRFSYACGYTITPDEFYKEGMHLIASLGAIVRTQSKDSLISKKTPHKKLHKRSNKTSIPDQVTQEAAEIRKPTKGRVPTHLWKGKTKNGVYKRPTLSIGQAVKEMITPRPLRVRNIKYKTFAPTIGARASPDAKDELVLNQLNELLEVAMRQVRVKPNT